METTILLIAVLLVGAMGLIVAEICTPTFGVLALSSLGCMVWACYLAFTVDTTFGMVLIVAELIGTPVFIYWAVRILPKTPLGKDLSDATAELRRERSAEPQPPARPPRGSHLKVVK